jgi:hypothetical protein
MSATSLGQAKWRGGVNNVFSKSTRVLRGKQKKNGATRVVNGFWLAADRLEGFIYSSWF